MHAGGADEREGDYCGSSLNRAARVMSVARGGQVLVSRLTASLGGRLPGIELVDVGDRRLRRITDPIGLTVARADGVDLDLTPSGGSPPRSSRVSMRMRCEERRPSPRGSSDFSGRDCLRSLAQSLTTMSVLSSIQSTLVPDTTLDVLALAMSST